MNTFTHKGKTYVKSGEECAQDVETELEEIFEVHYGCVITEGDFDRFELEEIDVVW